MPQEDCCYSSGAWISYSAAARWRKGRGTARLSDVASSIRAATTSLTEAGWRVPSKVTLRNVIHTLLRVTIQIAADT
jgi:hypothetical protein